MKKITYLIVALICLVGIQASAAKKILLDAQIEEAIEEFYDHTSAGKKLSEKAEGILIFPKVKKAGIGIGGEIGEGALIIDGKIVQYYRTMTASVGFQLGAQVKTQIILFMEKDALKKFRRADGWEVGLDGSVAIATLGAGGEIEGKTINEPVIGFIFGNKGLMYNLSLEGSKISKINK